MGCKGRRRRERNYRAAHGGGSKSLLPPPPDPSKVDSLPSKLRTLISLSSSHSEQSLGRTRKRDAEGGAVATKSKANKRDARREINPSLPLPPPRDAPADNAADHVDQKKRKKRKRGEPVDLRFQSSDYLSEGSRSRRKERRKAYREAKKKKHNKSSDQPGGDFPSPVHEKVEFGDVVDQPPRFAVLPKVVKFFEEASKQRLRLQAIEAYRNRKGWASKPGINLALAAVSQLSQSQVT